MDGLKMGTRGRDANVEMCGVTRMDKIRNDILGEVRK